MTKRIGKALFDLHAIGTRRAYVRFISHELSWWSDLDGDVIGAVVLDKIDSDYGWVMLARDLVGRFRCIDVDTSLASERLATARLRIAMSAQSRAHDFHGRVGQGDEPNVLLDLFEDRGVPDCDLHEYYLRLRDHLARQPARRVFELISPWLVSSDPHLVKEFQQSQFDQRLWEIYLWVMFRNEGFDVEHQTAPDLKVSLPDFQFTVEATTVAPSTSGPLAVHPEPETPQELEAFLADYMPMKYGSPLVSKLNKIDTHGRHYWQMPGAENIPFVIAIADFHKKADGNSLGSMTYSQGALYQYLYGTRVSAEIEEGKLIFRHTSIGSHSYNGKTVPSGFFDLPDAENVSAVLFSNAATLAKFDRMGVLAGFAPPRHKYIRIGYLFNPDPEALMGIPFKADVSDPSYDEGWGDEVQVFHNPRAIHPIPPPLLPEAAHFFYQDGMLKTLDRGGRVLSSITFIGHAMKESADLDPTTGLPLTPLSPAPS